MFKPHDECYFRLSQGLGQGPPAQDSRSWAKQSAQSILVLLVQNYGDGLKFETVIMTLQVTTYLELNLKGFTLVIELIRWVAWINGRNAMRPLGQIVG